MTTVTAPSPSEARSARVAMLRATSVVVVPR